MISKMFMQNNSYDKHDKMKVKPAFVNKMEKCKQCVWAKYKCHYLTNVYVLFFQQISDWMRLSPYGLTLATAATTATQVGHSSTVSTLTYSSPFVNHL